jgi:carbon-monoxide dehydrogenase medium subunit
MKPGAYYRPTDIPKALDLLSHPDSVILAGGTKLLASEAGLDAAHVVDLQALTLNSVDLVEGVLSVGATCTVAAFIAALGQTFPADPAAGLLALAAHRAGPNTYRNAATVGGTVGARLPDSELLAALLLFEAQLSLASLAGVTEMGLEAYLDADERPEGLITAVKFAWPDGRGAAERVARTPADYPIVSIAAWRDPADQFTLAATGLGPVPQRLSAAEAALAGGIDDSTIAEAAEAAAAANIHAGDFRGDVSYRQEMARVLTRRALSQLAA